MSAYPWYTRVTDIAHRLTVVGLVGFTLYMTAGVGYTLYQNGKLAEERVAKQKEAMAKQAELENNKEQ
ncbi:uncharacterized protein C5L36_0A07250 [Pichia kudriavzevii]|uniref:Cytochrome c oxidase assembly protein COX14 n=1 Tax=Pichia kudriavzevii TaxID=4909 RepID=A0A2U9QYM0_PICKU|nr:uncharacterized protein C5L36_0A07250 [Pichia kudriavzevii]AWU74123.1 hypothetical protein C5L36_0A07250 [Pichia kudriavzevii]